MYWTKTFIPTLKESPEGAEIPSHVLMLRAGLINQVMAGAYTYLPLGIRSLRKAEAIVRQEMDAAGAIELMMPSMSPIGLWEQTGRVQAFGDVLVRVELKRHNRKVTVVLGPTHEEIVTDLVAHHISSYRQLPITLYQITPKFRNEERPRFGVLRTSEFLMKDAYSFDASVEGLNRSYEAMYRAYCRIFDRCCLSYIPVEAESGPIGGDASHEFMVPADNGEDKIVHCKMCGYAANLERAEIGSRKGDETSNRMQPLELVATPGASTIEQVSRFLQCRPQDLIKTLIYLADGQPVAVLIRGDHEANENKIRRAFQAKEIVLADPKTIERVTGAPVGFAGPIGLKENIPIIADYDIQYVRNGVTGANQADAHYRGVNLGRDFQVTRFADLRCAVDNDPCPRCSGILRLRPAIEIGHVFKLGVKYSEALNARFLDADEQLKPIIMGCYGIGVNRILAALIETTHDENGIVWPVALAPYEVVIVPVNVTDEQTRHVATALHDELSKEEIDVILDDRDVRAGVKFKDADLIGFPLRIVVGERGLAQNSVEVKWRWDKNSQMLPLDSVVREVAQWIREERKTGQRFKSAVYGNRSGSPTR